MRYRKISVGIWNDAKVRELSPNGKLAFLFILTHPAMTSIGTLRGSAVGLCDELFRSVEGAFLEAFREVFANGLVEVSAEASLIVAPKFLQHNPPESPNVVRSWAHIIELVPECPLRLRHFQRITSFVHSLGEGYAKALPKGFAEGLPKGFAKPSPEAMPNPEPEPEQEQEQDLPMPMPKAQTVDSEGMHSVGDVLRQIGTGGHASNRSEVGNRQSATGNRQSPVPNDDVIAGLVMDIVQYEPPQKRIAARNSWRPRIEAMLSTRGGRAALEAFLDELKNRGDPRVCEAKGFNGPVKNPAAWLNAQTEKWLQQHTAAKGAA